MSTPTRDHEHIYDVLIVGGGAAGVGVAIVLQHAEIENFTILDREGIGASFAAWPAETRFITPSFPSNSIGMLDLNSIGIGFSPAYSLEVEHPTGREFAAHLQSIAEYEELPVRARTQVTRVTKIDELFHLETPEETLRARHVIWAAGEFQYPQLQGFPGSELCRHTASIASFAELEGDDFVIIGGYESGVDAAYHLARRGKRVRVLDRERPWASESSDPSISLSTYSLERSREETFVENVELVGNTEVSAVTRAGSKYVVEAKGGRCFETAVPPLFAGGFVGSHTLVAELFEQRDDGFPLVSEHDESTIVPGIFLCGPSLRHDDHVFCFIYKFRQRFAVVAKAIATSLGLPAEQLEAYRHWGMYLDDLSCCGEECASC